MRVVISRESGLNAPRVERVVSPRGVALYGVRCPPGASAEVLGRLKAFFRGTRMRVFAGHEAPTEWEWDTARTDPGPLGGGVPGESRLAELVASAFEEHDMESVVEGVAKGLPKRAPAPGRVHTDARDRHFAHPLRWVCLTEAAYAHLLPDILDAPSTANYDHLGYGDHMRVLAEWHTRYGIDVIQLGAGSLTVSLDRPPASARDISLAAVEQCAYCPDLFQVYGDVADVARVQAGSARWFFWWG